MSRSGLLRKEEDLSTRLSRLLQQDIDEVWIDAPDVYHDIKDFFRRAMPDQVDRVRLHESHRHLHRARLNQL